MLSASNIPAIPDFDDAKEFLLGLIFGPDSLIVALFVLLTALLSWITAARGASRKARQIYTHLRPLESSQRTRIIWNAIAILVTQSLYLLLGYFIAVASAVLLGLRDGVALPDYKNWINIPGTASWDPFTGWYFAISVLIVVASHVCAAKEWTLAPLWIFFLPGAAVALSLGLGFIQSLNPPEGDPQYTPETARSFGFMLGIVIVYLVLYISALYTPRRFYKAWRRTVRAARGLERLGDRRVQLDPPLLGRRWRMLLLAGVPLVEPGLRHSQRPASDRVWHLMACGVPEAGLIGA